MYYLFLHFTGDYIKIPGKVCVPYGETYWTYEDEAKQQCKLSSECRMFFKGCNDKFYYCGASTNIISPHSYVWIHCSTLYILGKFKSHSIPQLWIVVLQFYFFLNILLWYCILHIFPENNCYLDHLEDKPFPLTCFDDETREIQSELCAATAEEDGCEATWISIGCENTPGKVKDSCRSACNCNRKKIISYRKVQDNFPWNSS